MDSGFSPKRRRVALLLPNNMAVRNTLETPVLTELAAQKELEICFLTPSEVHAAKIKSANRDRFVWADIGNPAGRRLPLCSGPAGVALRRLAERALMKPIRPWAGWGNLVFRFNERQGFAGHLLKKNLPPERRKRENLAGNYPDPKFGRPLPRSRFLYELIYRLYHSTWYSEPGVEAFLNDYKPDLLVIHNVQNQAIRPWIASARRRRLPMLGIVGSWDQPTSKGPMPPGVGVFLVQSKFMKQELVEHHGIDPSRVQATGWPQMDFYQMPGAIRPKAELAAELGLAPGLDYVLFAGNSPRLGPHEPVVVQYLAKLLAEADIGRESTLVVRPHPNDNEWQARFGGVHNPPRVLVLPPEAGRMTFLADLLSHARLLVSTGGTISLDAMALDTPVINIGFDGDQSLAEHESIRTWFKAEHFAAIIDSGSVRFVKSYEELGRAVTGYWLDPAQDAAARAKCRQDHLEPLDGCSAKRVADCISRQAWA